MTSNRPAAIPLSVCAFPADGFWSVHLELTTRCNARCPMCPRTGQGAAREGLTLTELSLDDVCTIFPPKIVRGMRRIDLCGGFGDPIVAPAFDGAVEYFLTENSEIALHIFTNGGLRKAEWWAELAARIGPRGKVMFGIDGLEDTHAIYRAGTSFAVVTENARAFIGAGGNAQWDFLIFRHNQHQVDAARARAEAWGFRSFSPKVSGRFYKRLYEETPDLSTRYGTDLFPIYGKHGEQEGELQLPTDPRFQNATLVRMQTAVQSLGSLTPLLNQSRINCIAVADKSFFVSAEGTVFPCCWTYGASKYRDVFRMRDPENLQVVTLLERHGGPDQINGKFHPIEEIVKGPFFRALAESWSAPSVADGKTKICARMCGGQFSQEDQFQDPSLSPWQASRKQVP